MIENDPERYTPYMENTCPLCHKEDCECDFEYDEWEDTALSFNYQE